MLELSEDSSEEMTSDIEALVNDYMKNSEDPEEVADAAYMEKILAAVKVCNPDVDTMVKEGRGKQPAKRGKRRSKGREYHRSPERPVWKDLYESFVSEDVQLSFLGDEAAEVMEDEAVQPARKLGLLADKLACFGAALKGLVQSGPGEMNLRDVDTKVHELRLIVSLMEKECGIMHGRRPRSAGASEGGEFEEEEEEEGEDGEEEEDGNGEDGRRRSQPKEKLSGKAKRRQQQRNKMARQQSQPREAQLMVIEPEEMKSIELVVMKIRNFIHDDDYFSLRFPRLSRFDRRRVHIVAEAFLLRSESRGTGKFKAPELHKTDLSADIDEGEVEELRRIWKEGPSRRKQREVAVLETVLDEAPPGVVGQFASPISTDNIGHSMLMRMGWTPGAGLGPTHTGIVSPVTAVKRHSRKGLGGGGYEY